MGGTQIAGATQMQQMAPTPAPAPIPALSAVPTPAAFQLHSQPHGCQTTPTHHDHGTQPTQHTVTNPPPNAKPVPAPVPVLAPIPAPP